ncbi:MAG: hypothetical protein COX48_03940 [bacterium (Candidatus Stahlbacteria) CG23_combo_of_CG06-09_8_20_14_all_34_7]|nr:MAG: hypothetical protein COX48_03940 [bacterium (Candidatus Stahlbacteria) CG23_combo_of_CG06-09_8_20_14_all_34_7]
MSDYDNPRNTFIILDIRAKKLGGIKNLTKSEQIEYIGIGYQTGFLPKKDAEDLMKELNLKINLNSLTVHE